MSTKRYLKAVAYDLQLDNGGGKTPFALVSLRVVEGPETGHNYSKRCYLSDAAKEMTFKQLRALGWTGTKLSKAMQDGLGSRVADIRVEPETKDNGKTYDEVTGIFEPKEFKPRMQNAIETSDLDAFDAMFEDSAAAIQAEKPLSDLNRAPSTLPAAVKRASNGANTSKPANPNLLDF